ncbi:DUF1801 domain-containing protein [Pedobacter psychrodurus]|uniref:DUF1801 domain-containing protein n=1 Tax=Pedobacter psychrodurus TaxID=2530456 RepID=A0A4R0PYL4_9SPHI|nr:DUF1801 domain-containing protein [Pedobacter psychrodurus]TCD28212.1 DUF1801 domain-containing protein [Pedobacter psychrodurus]
MAAIKTTLNDANVEDFITSFAETEQKRKDGFELLKIMRDYTGFEAKMWGASMIGFGAYHYKSERSNREGEWPLVGFSPRKAAISLYVYMATPEHESLLGELGKFKMGKGCIYVNKLSDINIDVLEKMMGETIKRLKEKFPDKG